MSGNIPVRSMWDKEVRVDKEESVSAQVPQEDSGKRETRGGWYGQV